MSRIPDEAWDIDEAEAFFIAGSQASDATETAHTPQASQASQTSQTSRTSQAHRLRKNGTGTGAWNTPITHTETSAQTFGFDVKKAEKRNIRLGSEMKTRVVGPMPVEEFLETFLCARRVSFDDMPSPIDAFIDVLEEGTTATNERAIYKPLINALNAEKEPGTRGSRCPGFTFRDTSNNPDTSGGLVGAKKPDVCCYADHHLPDVEPKNASPSSLQSRTDMGLAATFIEIKLSPSSDPFVDPPSDADPVTRSTWSFCFGDAQGDTLTALLEIFGQIIVYASEVAMRQYRFCIFSVMVSGRVVRLFRWDRGGVVVTEAFDIHEHPEYLCRFFWCFSWLTDTDRGYDLTVEPASSEEERLFAELIEKHITRQLPTATAIERRTALEEHYSPSRVTSVSVLRKGGQDDDRVSYRYLVSRPIAIPLSVVGRATRAYWAVDAEAQKVVFLKDTWRYHDDHIAEGSTMMTLQRKWNVPNIPPVEYHGDVPLVTMVTHEDDGEDIIVPAYGRWQSTLTHKSLDRPWVCGDLEELRHHVYRRTHYRMVLSFAGYPLTKFRGTSELLHGAHDAFKAMRSAYTTCGYLHRDITPGNIILYNNGTGSAQGPRQGYLVDWELARVKSSKVVQTRHEASMSWQFVSVAVSSNTPAPHTIQDDMESLYYVVLYCALLYLPHRTNGHRLLGVLHSMFDWSIKEDATREGGGMGKAGDLFGGSLTLTIPWKCVHLRKWLHDVREFIREHGFAVGSAAPAKVTSFTPNAFASFWDKFFASHSGSTLPCDDRTDNISAKLPNFKNIAPRNALAKPYQPTMACQTMSTPTSSSHSSHMHAPPAPSEHGDTTTASGSGGGRIVAPLMGNAVPGPLALPSSHMSSPPPEADAAPSSIVTHSVPSVGLTNPFNRLAVASSTTSKGKSKRTSSHRPARKPVVHDGPAFVSFGLSTPTTAGDSRDTQDYEDPSSEMGKRKSAKDSSERSAKARKAGPARPA